MAGGSYVGLDIGSNLMKVAEIRRTGKGLELVALGIAATPHEAYENNDIVDPVAMSKAVKALLKEAGISTKQCVSTLSGQSAVVVRVIEVPKMNPAELKETMNYEVERHVPFASSGGGVITDYIPIDRPEGVADGQNMEVLLAAAQQDVVDRHWKLLFDAGLKPTAIEVQPLAAATALLDIPSAAAGAQPGHTVVIINIGASVTDVGIYRDNLLCFSRTLPFGGDQFTRAIAEQLQVDTQTAETYKREIGEVILDPYAGHQGGGFAPPAYGAAPDMGFMDFGSQTPIPSATTEASPSGRTPFEVGVPQDGSPLSSPSGRMPFDFASPGEAPPPPTGFEAPGQPMAPAETPGFYQPQAEFMAPGGMQDGGYQQPAYSAPEQDPHLPVATGGDAGRDALRHQVYAAIAPVLLDLSQDIRRSLEYYQSRTNDAPVHEAILIGGTAKLKGLATYLELQLGIVTHVGDPFSGLTISSKQFSEEKLHEMSALFTVTVGLGARDLMAVPGKGKKK